MLWLLPLGIVGGLGVASLVQRLAPWPETVPSAGPMSLAPGSTQGSTRPPLLVNLAVVAATASLFGLVAVRYSEPWHVALVDAYVAVLVTCAATDLLTYRVPNAIVYPAAAVALAVGLIIPGAHPADVVAGGLLAGTVFLVPAAFTRGRGIGMGDVKLAVFMGLMLGLSRTPAALMVTAILGGLVAATLLALGSRRRGHVIPYAPFLAAGGLTLMLWQGTAFVAVS